MTTILLAENRRLGVTWLNNNITEDDDRVTRRTQTEITLNTGEKFLVVTKQEHMRGVVPDANDRLILLGAVDDGLHNHVIEYYRARGIRIHTDNGNGRVLTAAELKRQALIRQLEDLDKEERLHRACMDLTFPGAIVNKVEISNNTQKRSFYIQLYGTYVD